MASASVARPVLEPAAVGELSPLARRALEMRLERAQSSWQSREGLQEVAPRQGETPRRLNSEALGPGRDQGQEHAAPGSPAPERVVRDLALMRALRGLGGDGALSRLATRPAPTSDQLPHATLRSVQPPTHDGNALREIAGELRALRAEVSQLSRQLGRPVRVAADFQGVLQPPDRRNSDYQLAQFRETEPSHHENLVDEASRKQAQQAALERARLQQTIQSNEAARVEQRQRDLLRALERAERRLAEAPERLPVGVRDEIIGEIYRARYSIALFGGASGLGQLGGTAFDRAI